MFTACDLTRFSRSFSRSSAARACRSALLVSVLMAGGSALAEPQVALRTNQGTIVIELDDKAAPKSSANFLRYVQDKFYDGTIFHRVIQGFMIQGGGFTPTMEQKATAEPIENEAANGLKNRRGTIAMARTRDPHSATAQFFINHADNDNLDYPSFDGWGYAVFGKVISGMDVVDRIAETAVSNKMGHQNVPVTAIVVNEAVVVKDK